MKSGVITIINNMPKLLRSLKKFPDIDVLVGIPEDKANREEGDPISNAAIGYIAETGAPERNIPQRAWLVPAIQGAKVQISKHMMQAGKAMLEGNVELCNKALNAAGIVGQNAARKKINTGPFEALAPGTLAARRRRGRTGTKPLIDTGQLRNSISYVVRGGSK